MATLVLSTVGTALGGPVGGAIGALVGQSIDQQLLGPATRGPRLGDLKVQSSSYGTQIPRIYGSMRVAGTVIWSTDLVESSKSPGAKGQPDATYSYSVSLAVALSSRPARSIGRIWADGKLLRGATGDLKVSATFRFYSGREDQDIDPLIGSAEGLANTPAYRGLAMAVFEDLELADYGNRIPFLTFEVFADDGPMTVGAILNEASDGLIDSTEPQELSGYAAYGQSIKAAIQPLVNCYAVELCDDGSRLVTPDAAVTIIGNDELGNSSDSQKAARIQREQLPPRSLPSALRLGYYDPALDYQSGEARAISAEKRATEQRLELPATISAAEAKSLVERMIAREWARRDKLTLRLAPRLVALQPGARVQLDLTPHSWCIEQSTVDGFVVVAELRPAWTVDASLAADPGRIISDADLPAPGVTLAVFDVPDVLAQGSANPLLLLAASTPSGGWKGYNVEILAGQQSVQVQVARRKTILGQASTALGPGDPYLINESGSFEVELIDQEQWLVSCDDESLVAGSNLAILGSEVLQFGSAEALGQGRFKLSRLLRGRAGTEWAMNGHAAGEPFAMVDPDALRPVALPKWAIGASVNASLTNVAGTTTSAPIVLSGESLRPVAPVNLAAAADSAGGLSLIWTRRSRQGFAWIDQVDAPLGESSEQYRVTIFGAEASLELNTSAPALGISAAQLSDAGSGPITIEVRQIGDAAASRPAQLTVGI
jgi:hypothetical protein